MNYVIGPELPVGRRPHAIRIPSRAFKSRAPIRQPIEQELAAAAFEKTSQMGRIDIVWTPFPHRRGLGHDAELQQLIGFPCFDRLEESSCGKNTPTDCSHTRAANLRALRVSHAAAEKPIGRFW